MSTNLETAATRIDLPKEPVVERKAQTLEEVWANFDPTLAVDPATQFYIARQADRLHSCASSLCALAVISMPFCVGTGAAARPPN